MHHWSPFLVPPFLVPISLRFYLFLTAILTKLPPPSLYVFWVGTGWAGSTQTEASGSLCLQPWNAWIEHGFCSMNVDLLGANRPQISLGCKLYLSKLKQKTSEVWNINPETVSEICIWNWNLLGLTPEPLPLSIIPKALSITPKV